MRRFLEFIAARLPVRMIYVDGKEYLRRLYICGSLPTKYWPGVKPRLGWLPWTLYLHEFYAPDRDRNLHSHPWKWAVSLILAGWYREQVLAADKQLVNLRKAGRVNVIRQTTFHRIQSISHLVRPWTLFLAGPKASTWGFVDPDAVVGHREYFSDSSD